MKKIILLTLACLLLGGCVTFDQLSGLAAVEKKKQADKALAQIKCKALCQDEIISDRDFSAGPCLSNEIIPDWVCDIAHSPRIDVDDDPANQCPAFKTGEAHHFVELDGNCNLIQIY